MQLGLEAEDVRRALLLREALRQRGQDPALAPLLGRLLPPAARAQLLGGAPASLPVDHETEALSVRWARRSRHEDPESVRLVLVGCESTRDYAGVLPLPGSESGLGGQVGAAPEAAIGGYEILAEIARGGMGVVYRARDPRLEREVALKVLSGVDDEEARERFAIEARATARLSHPHIVGIQAVGEDHGRPYLVMDLVEGRSLKAELDDVGPLEPRRAAQLVADLADALAYAHARAILHRDLKPHNVLLDRADRARLTDFGLAKEVARGETLTATGQVLGTPAYMSPEQAQGDPQLIDRRSDVYGLGATLYALLTGRPPFRGATVWNVLDAVAHDPVEPPRSLRPEVEHDLETIVLTCLEKEPDQRYGTMQALREDLQRYLDDQPISARRPSLGERLLRGLRRHRRLVLAAALLLLALAGVASGAWFRATAANVAAAREAAAEARRNYQQQREAPIEERTGLALRSLQTALLRYEVEGRSAEGDLVAAASEFAQVAAEGAQWSVGLEALKQCELLERLAPSSKAELSRQRDELERRRAELVQQRLAKVEAVLAGLASGERSDVDDAVVEITRYPGPETARLLLERLRGLNRKLYEGTLEAFLEVAQPTEFERTAGLRPIEGVRAAWARFADPAHEPKPEPVLGALGERLLVREQREPNTTLLEVLRRLQAKLLSGPEVNLLHALCHSLGQLGVPEAVPVLAKQLRIELQEEHALAAARGLYWLGTPAAHEVLGRHYRRFGGLGTALFEFVLERGLGQREVELENPVRPLLARARGYAQQGNTKAALATLTEAEEWAKDNDPSSVPEVQITRAVLYQQLGQLERARETVEAVLTGWPTQIRAHMVLAEIALEEGDLAAAERACAEAIRHGPRHSGALVVKAKVDLRARSIEAAGEGLRRALRLDPESLAALFLQSELYLRRGDMKAALRSSDRYLARAPWDLAARMGNLQICVRTGHFEQALARSERLLTLADLKPSYRVTCLDLRCRAALASNQLELAVAAAEELVEVAPASPVGPLAQAEVLAMQRRIGEAERALAEAKRRAAGVRDLDPELSERLVLTQVQILTSRAKVQQALALCDRALAQNGDHFLLRVNRCDLRMRSGDLPGAHQDLNWCLERKPGEYIVLNLLAHMHLFEGELAEAEGVFDQLLDRVRGRRVLMGRALARLGLGKFELAVRDASDVLVTMPSETEALLLRGTALAKLGRLDEARRDLELAAQQGTPRQQARARRALTQLPR